MLFADFAPPSLPTLDQQRDALRKGFGRAMQWAKTGQLDDGPLLETCLKDHRYDVQIEESRGDWLWRMIQAVGAADRFRVPILHALYDLSDDRSANQLCELARCYAEKGDEAFRTRLYDIVEQKPIDDRGWLGEYEIVQLDGEKGFLFAARLRGEQLASREWDDYDDVLVAHAVEQFGEGRVNEILSRSRDQGIDSFRIAWHRQNELKSTQEQRLPYREKFRAITVTDILKAAESDEPAFNYFRGWGMCAEEADLEIILRHLRSAREPMLLANLLQVFLRRATPRFDDCLIELCRHSDTEVRRRALLVLGHTEHPRVREFALAELGSKVRGHSVVGLFARNYQQGDEYRIRESIEIPEDNWECHSLLMDVISVLEANPEADCSQLGIIVYALTPCQECRFDAARLLLDQQVAPQWLTDECQYDVSERCRGLVDISEGSPEVG